MTTTRKPGRNPNGEGTDIARRPDGRYRASIRLGAGRRKYLYGRTRNEVRTKLARARGQLGTVAWDPDRLNLADHLRDWLAAATPRLEESTRTRYEQLIRLHLAPVLGRLTLAKLAPQHIRRLYADKQAAGLSPTTVRQVHAVLHQALDQAVADGIIARNPAGRGIIKAPRPDRYEPAVLAPEEARQFLAALAGDRLEALYWLALTTGMREGEILGLRWRDVDLRAARLFVRSSLRWRTGGTWYLKPPKTEKSARELLLAPFVVEGLRRHRAAQLEERLGAGAAWTEHDLVFADAAGGPLTGQHVLRVSFRGLLRKAGLPATMRVHDLRHSLGTMLEKAGVPASVVSSILGHSQISTTMNIYVHPRPEMQSQAIEAVSRLLGPPA